MKFFTLEMWILCGFDVFLWAENWIMIVKGYANFLLCTLIMSPKKTNVSFLSAEKILPLTIQDVDSFW